MKKDKEYIVFLNKMEGIDNLYRQSSSLYGIVPFKEKINILLIGASLALNSHLVGIEATLVQTGFSYTALTIP